MFSVCAVVEGIRSFCCHRFVILLECLVSIRARVDHRCGNLGTRQSQVLQDQIEISVIGDRCFRNVAVGVGDHLTGEISYACEYIQGTLIVIVDAVQNYLAVFDRVHLILQVIIQSGCADCDVVQHVTEDIYKDASDSAAQMDLAVQFHIAGTRVSALPGDLCIRIQNDFHKDVDPFDDLLGDPFHEPADERDLADFLDDLFNYVLYFRPYLLDDSVCNRCSVSGDGCFLQVRSIRDDIDLFTCKFCLVSCLDVDMVRAVHRGVCEHFSGSADDLCIGFCPELLLHDDALNIENLCSAYPCIADDDIEIVICVDVRGRCCVRTGCCRLGQCVRVDQLIGDIASDGCDPAEDPGLRISIRVDLGMDLHFAQDVSNTFIVRYDGSCLTECRRIQITVEI